MKKIITILVILALIAVVAMTLMSNKKKLDEKLKVNDIAVDMPVTVETVKTGKLSDNLSIVGVVNANNDITLLSETSGRVTAVYARNGANVRAGSIIAKVDDEVANANYLSAKANYEKTKKDFDRMQALLNSKSVTESQYDATKFALQTAESQMTITKRALEDTKIKSPINGIMTERLVDIGTKLSNGTAVANIVDVSSLKVKLSLPEKEVFKLKTGDAVDITTEIYPGVKMKGKVESISAKGDASHTYPVEIVLQNSAKYSLKAGMFARVDFVSIQNSEHVIIPRRALTGSTKNASVFVVNAEGKAEYRQITVGKSAETELEVISGLQPGEALVVNGQNNLRNQTKVKVVNK